MKLLCAPLLGLVLFALVSPVLVPFRPQCGMACCRRPAMARRAACAALSTCSVGAACAKTGTVANLPSLPVSTLPALPRLDVLAVAGPFAGVPTAGASSFPPCPAERPPRT